MAFNKNFFSSANQAAMPQTFRPQMTSLVDILTLLLVFLIQSFSAEGTLITASDDLKLPTSTSREQPKPSLTLEITQKAVISEGKVIEPLTPTSDNSPLLMDNLYRFILTKKKTVVDTAKGLDIIIQCDEEMPFHAVKRVMFSCSKAGCDNFSVLAIQKD